MEPKYKLTIPKPCQEDWNVMTPNSLGRFYGSCEKNVIDFTTMNPSEIQNYFVSNQGKRICGRFSSQQLDSVIIQIPNQILYSQTNFYKMFLLALLISMGTTLFSCADKNGNKQKIDGVEVVSDSFGNDGVLVGEAPIIEDTLRHNHNLLVPPPPLKSKINEVKFVKEEPVITLGMTMPERIKDSLITK